MRALFAFGVSLLTFTLATRPTAAQRAPSPARSPFDAGTSAGLAGGSAGAEPLADVVAPLAGAPSLRAAYASFGQAVGWGGIATASVQGRTEIYVNAFGPDTSNFWYAAARDETTGGYEPTFVRPNDESQFVWRLDVADVHPAAGPEIVALRTDGVVEIWSAETKQRLTSFPTGVTNEIGFIPFFPAGMRFADLDGDGLDEIWCVGKGLAAYRSTGERLWQTSDLFGNELAVGQMDADPSLEVATTDGRVIDVQTGATQCTFAGGFGVPMALIDVNGDGRQELVAARGSASVRGFNAGACQQTWALSVSGPADETMALAVADVDGDGADEVLVGAAGTGQIRGYSPATTQALWAIPNPLDGANWLAAADLDGDGAREVVWGAGEFDGGPSRLFVGDPAAQAVVWQNPAQLDGPFVGPALGDVDGDGTPEIVAASTSTDGREGPGRVVVLDAATLALKAMSPPVANAPAVVGVVALELRNVDADPALEIVLGTDVNGEGLVEIFDLGPDGSFDLAWSKAAAVPSSAFFAVDVADLEGDGRLEVVATLSRYAAGEADDAVYVYDYETGDEVWHSAPVAPGGARPGLAVADSDGDGVVDVHALLAAGSVYVYDGATRDLRAVVSEAVRSLDVRRQRNSLLPYVWTADAAGRVAAHRWAGAAYAELGAVALPLGAPLGALTVGPFQSFFAAGEDGTLSFFPTAASAAPSWTLQRLGSSFGRRVVTLESASSFVTAGDYAVFAFGAP